MKWDIEEFFENLTLSKALLYILIIIVAYSYLGDFLFTLAHSNPIASEFNLPPVNTDNDPIQTDVPSQFVRGKKGVFFEYKAKYSLSGYIVARNRTLGLKILQRNIFDENSIIDIGAIWGNIANEEFFQNCKLKSKKYNATGARMLNWSCKNYNDYIPSHISHNHLIPANDNLASALLKIKKKQKIKLDGYLVDIHLPNGGIIRTSLSRDDQDSTSRGSGACEVLYVTGAQIGKKYYK